MRHSAEQAWEAGALIRRPLLTRCEKYAAFTLPTICTPEGYNEQSEELQTDYQSVGAQAVNGLANKLMLALFAPSRPFFRLDLPSTLLKQLMDRLGITEASIQSKLSVAEQNCIKQLDRMGVRPQLYLALKHLIITGNCLLILGKKDKRPLRVLGLKRYTVKRSMSGKVIEIVVHEKIKFDELDDDVQSALKKLYPTQYLSQDPANPATCKEVKYFTWVRWNGRKYQVTHHVDDYDLPQEFNGAYTEKTLPYRALTWELSDENNYGTGLVEQFSGAFASLSTLSEAEVQAAVLASEFRWLVNPAGVTAPSDLENSANGAAIPGVKDDILPLTTGTGQALQLLDAVTTKYINQIGRGFLMGSAVIRDAERVTAEEVRLQANELETSFGGVYSCLALDFQLPMAYWLVELSDVDLGGTQIEPTIITGLDALSRNGDLDNLKLCLQDLAALSGLPPQTQFVLKMDAIAQAVFAGRGVDGTQYVKSQAEQQQDMQNQQAMQLAQQVARPATTAVLNAAQ